MGEWDNTKDVVQMVILYFIYTFILSQVDNAPISTDDFRMVEDGRNEFYPWGLTAFNKLLKSLRKECRVAKKLYRLGGIQYIVNMWMYDCASQVDEEIVIKVGLKFPEF